jgi:hypothetical protein
LARNYAPSRSSIFDVVIFTCIDTTIGDHLELATWSLKVSAKILDARDDGRTPHGIAKKLLLEGQECFPEMNMNMINYTVKKLAEEESGIVDRLENNSKLGTAQLLHLGGSSISSLSDDVTGKNSRETSAAIAMLSLTSDNSTDSKAVASAGSKGSATSATEVSIGDFISAMQQSRNKDEPCNHFGRPKGTTAADLMCLAERTELATQEAMEWLARYNKNCRSKKRLKKGSLQDVINAAKEKFDIDDTIIISCRTV